MSIKQIRKTFINKTARKPEGRWAVRNYNNPRAHYRSFKIIMNKLSLNETDAYCEIGCGGGVLLKMALSAVKKAAAIDHSREMVSLAIKNNRSNVEAKKVEIVEGSAEKLPWEDGAFTACGSANMFFFVENPVAMLEEVYRVLKPGGRFCMVTMGRGLLCRLTFGWLYSLKTYSDDRMIEMMKAAGFLNFQVTTGWSCMQVCYVEKH